jgi:hypothetical protein
LCDFGRSRIIGRGGFTSRVLGVLVYQAPELQGLEGVAIADGTEAGVTIVEKEIFSDKLTKQTDVYAYAMVTLEVCSKVHRVLSWSDLSRVFVRSSPENHLTTMSGTSTPGWAS